MNDTPRTDPPKTGLQPFEIMKAIREKHGAVLEFAKKIPANYDFTRDVIHGREVSARVAAAVAAVVGLEPHQIWPKLYAEDGGALSTAYRRAS